MNQAACIMLLNIVCQHRRLYSLEKHSSAIHALR